ncbi:D-alanyl-D-alanine carboxypeptidase [Clostridium acidisoli DSM 12555]|uniref:serine-type D-Ala-D-Ala carboxypeptidase n=1 Tax=Clostridium acidisoli DSM 12555 TaxID=1121291 RepID=A0A1W1X0U7_9CLOT|nr:D-alanyl-D-alanine carboxypeptidase family protein [Clostridium acidisoli]SMC17348.1 D-alanyl-D-alanine carboxypeptidase [Clostridium acidisoli DSM 12555]
MNLNKCIIRLITVLLIINITTFNVYGENLNVNAVTAIAMDSESKTILFEKNSQMIVPMASTTKIMTALVALKYGKLDKKVTISKNAASIRGSKVGYKTGEVIAMKELLYGLMFRSGNDAAIAIAEDLGKDIKGFSKLMNEYALEIGAVNSHFETPHGLDSENHYSTAYDLALITSKAKENKLFNEIVSSKDIKAETLGFTRDYHNINKILYQIPGANGVKTGSTGKAGKCLVTSVNMNGHDVIFVVLNCTPRWKETTKMYKYVSDKFSYKKLYSKNQVINEVKLPMGKLQLTVSKDIVLPLENNKNYEVKMRIPKNGEVNIKKGDIMGEIQVFNENKEVYVAPLEAKNSIGIKRWFNKE